VRKSGQSKGVSPEPFTTRETDPTGIKNCCCQGSVLLAMNHGVGLGPTLYDVVVVGLGAVGSFALRALAKQGQGARVLGVEQFRLGHHGRGSSHGRSRIYRRAYFEHPSYVPWIEHSIRVFRDLERSQNKSLLEECGCLLLAPSSSSPNSLPPLLASSLASASQHDIPVEYLATNDLKQRYPQLLYKHDLVGLLEPQAGILRPERVMRAAVADAMSEANVEIMDESHVIGVEAVAVGSNQHHLVRIKNSVSGEVEEILTRTVLLSTGAYVSRLVPSWAHLLKVTRQFQCWIDLSSSPHRSSYSSKDLPAWYMETPDWPIPVYGIPTDPNADDVEARHWLKVSSHGRDTVVHESLLNPSKLNLEEIQECRTVAAAGLDPAAWEHLPESSKDAFFVESVPCMYTMTPDKNYMIGSPSPGVFCVAGLSGHGFKMAPALGQMLADFALGADMSNWQLDFCSPSRFGL
jgi:sarcosine oxidase